MKTCSECLNQYEDSFQSCPADSTLLKVIEKDPFLGSRLADRYQILSVIGHGGMGVVYKARQEHMDRFVAIKMLHSHMATEPEAIKRFYREAKTVSQVKHHNIITLYDFGISEKGQPYLVMDFLEGKNLKDLINESGPLSLKRVGSIFTQVIEALQTAHEFDLVHRDLKPANIMLRRWGNQDDWVTLVDFGLSKLRDVKSKDAFQVTKSGGVCGSPSYMSPEQCLSSQVVDPRSDIYSLAICVYEAVSGKLPFQAKSAIEMLGCHVHAVPIPLGEISPQLQACSELTNLFNKALQKEPEKRYQTAEEFGRQLSEALERDWLRLRTFSHRLKVASLQDPMSGEHALASRETLSQRSTSFNGVIDEMQAQEFNLSPQVEVGDVLALRDAQCDGSISLSNLAQLRSSQDMSSPKESTPHSESRGFSSRAKKVMSRSPMPHGQKLLTLIMLILLFSFGCATWQNGAMVRSVNRVVTALYLPH